MVLIGLVLALTAQEPEALDKSRKLCGAAAEKMGAGELDAAIRLLDEAIRTAPRHAFAFGMRGDVKLQAGRPEDALKDLDRALELGLEKAEVAQFLLIRAWARMTLLKHEAALDDARKAAGINPPSSYGFLTLATVHLRMGSDDEVLKSTTRAIELDPDSGWARGLRGQAHFRKGLHEAALADYLEAIRLHPEDTISPPCVGMILRIQGKPDEALARFEKTFKDLPALYSGLWIWALRSERGDAAAAVDALRAMKARGTGNALHAWHLKVVDYLEGSLTETQLLDEAKKALPSDAVERRTEALFFSGLLLVRKGDKAGAIERFKQVREAAVWAVEPLMAELELKRLQK